MSGGTGSPVGALVGLLVLALVALWVLHTLIGIVLWGSGVLAVAVLIVGFLALMSSSRKGR